MAESAVEKVEALKRKKEEEEEMRRHWTETGPDWLDFPREMKELKAKGRKLKYKPWCVERDSEEAEIAKAMRDKRAEAEEVFMKTRGGDTWWETQWRAEEMMSQVLEASGLYDPKLEEAMTALRASVPMPSASGRENEG